MCVDDVTGRKLRSSARNLGNIWGLPVFNDVIFQLTFVLSLRPLKWQWCFWGHRACAESGRQDMQETNLWWDCHGWLGWRSGWGGGVCVVCVWAYLRAYFIYFLIYGSRQLYHLLNLVDRHRNGLQYDWVRLTARYYLEFQPLAARFRGTKCEKSCPETWSLHEVFECSQ